MVIIGITYFPGDALARWFEEVATRAVPFGITLVVAMIIVFFVGWLALIITHEVGESLCDNFAARGLELRGPRRK